MSHMRGRIKTRIGSSSERRGGSLRSASPLAKQSDDAKVSKTLISNAPSSWPYDQYYSNVLSAIADAPVGANDGSELVKLSALRQIQQDLASLVNSSNKRSKKCADHVSYLNDIKTTAGGEADSYGFGDERGESEQDQVQSRDEDSGQEQLQKQEGGDGDDDDEEENEGDDEEEEDEEARDATERKHANDKSGVMDMDIDTNNQTDNSKENSNEPTLDEVTVKSEYNDGDIEMKDMTAYQRSSKSPVEYEKNPKSEFVEAQTIPIAALNLFEHAVKGLPHHGEEYLKKKYGVASYPTVDLKEMLPGEIPDQDFTRAKPTNQVQFSTFCTAIEPFFKTFGEEEMSFLKQRAVGGDSQYGRPGALSPYVIPPIGPSYTETWAGEDGNNPGYSLSPPPPVIKKEQAKGTEESITEAVLESNSVSCGPLASRLLSALLPERTASESNNSLESTGGEDPNEEEESKSKLIDASWKTNAAKSDFKSLDERLKKEFRYVGILDMSLPNEKMGETAKADDEIDWTNEREDDEICYELRLLQKKLKMVTKVNQACKRRLQPLVQEQMAYQEYSTILDDLDKQVDQAYVKKFRNPKTKKKKGVATSTVATNVEKPNIKILMDKRQRWVDKIGPVFKPDYIMKRVPKESVFKDLQLEDDDEDEEYEEFV